MARSYWCSGPRWLQQEGFLYSATDAIGLTWDAYDPGYSCIVDKFPWMLGPAEQAAVEAALRSGLRGEPYRFANPPSCPRCEGALRDLASASRECFVVTGDRLDASTDAVWAS